MNDEHDDEPTFLTYADAAKRVSSSVRTVNRWAAAGMAVEWRAEDDGRRFRVVEESVLLKWYRERMTASPVHFYRMRAKAVAAGEAPPPVPARFRRDPKRAQDAIEHAPQPTRVPEEGDAPETTSDAFARLLADLPDFHGQPEHAALMRAMQDQQPACDGLDVFTADRFDDPEQTDMMRGICRACPLLDLCAAFAAVGKPTAGMWAGLTPAQIHQPRQAA